MNERMLNQMDRWITGNYGQDRFDNWLDDPEDDDYKPFGCQEELEEEDDE